MSIFLMLSGVGREMESKHKKPIDLGIVESYYVLPIPTLDHEVERAARLQKPGATGKERTEGATVQVHLVHGARNGSRCCCFAVRTRAADFRAAGARSCCGGHSSR